MRTIAYCVSIVIGWKVQHKFLIEELLMKKMCVCVAECLKEYLLRTENITQAN